MRETADLTSGDPRRMFWKDGCWVLARLSQRASRLFNTSVEKFVEKTSRARDKHPNLNSF
jgi:hypothetical protein